MLTQPTTWNGIDSLALSDVDERYADRIAAGRQLAQLLLPDRDSRALVLALPPGGMLVAGAVAHALRLPLDVLVAREIAIRPYQALIAGGAERGRRAVPRPGALPAAGCDAQQLLAGGAARGGRDRAAGGALPPRALAAIAPASLGDSGG
jgi:hypothetical protein